MLGRPCALQGHVHAYERSYPVYNGCPSECGPMYFLLGDGGNYEGAYVPWLEPQPLWSAFRESTFGGGTSRAASTHQQASRLRSLQTIESRLRSNSCLP